VAPESNRTELRSAGPRIPPRRLSDIEHSAVEYAAASRRRTVRIVGTGVVALAIGLLVLAIVGRDGMLAVWPSTAGVYRALNLVPAPADGLKVTLTVTRKGGALVVVGDIVSSAAEARDVPPLRVSLQDARRNDVDTRTIDPPVARLAPGATARFETVFEHPNMTATGAAAIFAIRR
jgi:hypothetical protein